MVNNEYSLHRRRVKRRDSVVSAALRRHVCIEAPRVVPSGPMASAWDPIQAVLYQFIYIFIFSFFIFHFFFFSFIYFLNFFFFGRVFLFLFSSCKDSWCEFQWHLPYRAPLFGSQRSMAAAVRRPTATYSSSILTLCFSLVASTIANSRRQRVDCQCAANNRWIDQQMNHSWSLFCFVLFLFFY